MHKTLIDNLTVEELVRYERVNLPQTVLDAIEESWEEGYDAGHAAGYKECEDEYLEEDESWEALDD